MTIYCDDFPILEGDFRHEGGEASGCRVDRWEIKTQGESGGWQEAGARGFKIIRGEIKKWEERGWMNGTARGRGRNSHGCMHVPQSIDPWNDAAESTAPGKWPFPLGLSVIFDPSSWPARTAGLVFLSTRTMWPRKAA